MDIPSFIIYAIVTIFTPGPNNIVCMNNGTRLGFKKAFPYCAGASTGFFFLLVLSFAFTTVLYSFIPQVQSFMSYVGAAYILYLAYTVVRAKPHAPQGEEKAIRSLHADSYFAGLLFQFINPKGILFGLTILSNYLMRYFQSTAVIMLFCLLLSLAALASTILWTLLGAGISGVFNKHRLLLNIAMALALVYCAVMLLLPHA